MNVSSGERQDHLARGVAMRHQLAFLIAGLTAGLLTILLGMVSVMFLVFGVGALFFLAVMAAIAITRGWSQLIGGPWRYGAAFGMFVAAYVVALFTFLVVTRYSVLLGLRESTDITQFGADIWIGLLAAALLSAICIELAIYVLTDRWSNSFLVCLISGGFLTVVVTFAAKFLLGEHWSFPVILFPVGDALFGWVVGSQIWKASGRQIVSGR